MEQYLKKKELEIINRFNKITLSTIIAIRISIILLVLDMVGIFISISNRNSKEGIAGLIAFAIVLFILIVKLLDEYKIASEYLEMNLRNNDITNDDNSEELLKAINIIMKNTSKHNYIECTNKEDQKGFEILESMEAIYTDFIGNKLMYIYKLEDKTSNQNKNLIELLYYRYGYNGKYTMNQIDKYDLKNLFRILNKENCYTSHNYLIKEYYITEDNYEWR